LRTNLNRWYKKPLKLLKLLSNKKLRLLFQKLQLKLPLNNHLNSQLKKKSKEKGVITGTEITKITEIGHSEAKVITEETTGIQEKGKEKSVSTNLNSKKRREKRYKQKTAIIQHHLNKLVNSEETKLKSLRMMASL
jgi:hypothetical protein